MSNLSKIILYIFKISIHNKCYIGSTYDYFQYKIKIINRINNTNIYSKIAEYIKKNDIEDTDIHLSVIAKKELQNKDKDNKLKITNEFINLYDSINSGFNKPTKSIQKISQDYYNQYKSKILNERNNDYNRNKSKQYYHDNKEFILKKNKEKVKCVCNSWVCRVQMRRHVLTKKHAFLMTKLK
jgi:hypothetical protein